MKLQYGSYQLLTVKYTIHLSNDFSAYFVNFSIHFSILYCSLYDSGSPWIRMVAYPGEFCNVKQRILRGPIMGWFFQMLIR